MGSSFLSPSPDRPPLRRAIPDGLPPGAPGQSTHGGAAWEGRGIGLSNGVPPGRPRARPDGHTSREPNDYPEDAARAVFQILENMSLQVRSTTSSKSCRRTFLRSGRSRRVNSKTLSDRGIGFLRSRTTLIVLAPRPPLGDASVSRVALGLAERRRKYANVDLKYETRSYRVSRCQSGSPLRLQTKQFVAQPLRISIKLDGRQRGSFAEVC